MYIIMSVFRPINSAESNLFIIRAVVDLKNTVASESTDQLIVAGPNTDTTTPNYKSAALISPTSNNLPEYFGILYDVSAKGFTIIYGKEFTSQPTIIINPRINDVPSASDSTYDFITQVFYKNNTKWSLAPTTPQTRYPGDVSGNYNAFFMFKSAKDGDVTIGNNGSTNWATIIGFDITIIGPVKLGVTTGNSNKGWSVGSGADPNNLYAYMNVGIGTGNPQSLLEIKGRLDNKITKFQPGSSNIFSYTGNTRTLSKTEILLEILEITPNTDGSTSNSGGGDGTTNTILTLDSIANITTEYNSIFSPHTVTEYDSFSLTIINKSTVSGHDITLTATTDQTIIGDAVIYSTASSSFLNSYTTGSSIATFKFVWDSTTTLRIYRIAG